MLRLNILTEFRTIKRNYWLSFITVLLLSLCLYAGWNGQNRVVQRQNSIAAAINQMKASDALMMAHLDSLSAGHGINLASWQYPSLPTAAGDLNPRVTPFNPSHLSFVATGQSDMFNHYVKPTLTDDNFSIAFTELASPVSLLLGNFDLSFVLVYLLPLVIISFSYNILSSEKEQGSFKLIATSPLSLRLWLLQKVLVRFAIIVILLLTSLFIMFILFKVSINKLVLIFMLQVCLYLAFWFVLAYLLNLRGASSSTNAIVLLGCWVIVVLAIPSLVGQSANVLYPTPSRTMLINEMRSLQATVDKEQDKILDDYLRSHPELVTREADESTAYGWWQRYFASKNLMLEKMGPLLTEYDQSLKKQQEWVHKLSFLSPSILLQNNLNHISNTSTAHYNSYRESVLHFTDQWRDFFLPLVFQEEAFTKEMVAKLPKFHFDSSKVQSPILLNSTIMVIIITSLLLLSFTIGIKTE
ncbi:DUF3526 domain-containing protein [Allomuricauda sp. XS_ASV26]|uniref:DUF3526 domain-containing protein n=1 Tax=Allomuricauda sp. XS_ASV26 TaxID=3241292 RepID=UPI003514305F